MRKKLSYKEEQQYARYLEEVQIYYRVSISDDIIKLYI